jgi:uncharacterized protein YdeI (YjbR/CyaY-like superfamily)
MGIRDPRVDLYIAKSAAFAKPILEHLRETVHAACPDVAETIRWGFPHFDANGMLCSMASFKAHCAFGFWKGDLLFGDTPKGKDAMGHFGRVCSVADLPSRRELVRLVKAARKLNDGGPMPRTKAKAPKPLVDVPADLAAALGRDAKARATFERFPPSHRREYVEWIVEAKRDETRARRVAQAVTWMAEGRSRNWKYERK